MKNLNYILMVLLGGVLYGTMSSFVKMSYTRGYTPAEVSFWQAFLAAVLLAALTLIKWKDQTRYTTRKDILPLLLTGGAIGLTNFFYYLSVSYISASLAIVILMQFTWFSVLLEWMVFGKKPSSVEVVTILFIPIGTLLAGDTFNLSMESFSPKGAALALLSSLTYAIYIIANGRVNKTVKWQSKSALIMIGSSLTIFMINASSITTSSHMGIVFFTWAITLAVAGTTIPTALFSIGIPKIGTVTSSILMTNEFPVAIVCAHTVLHERVKLLQTGGIVVMLAAITYMNYYKVRRVRTIQVDDTGKAR